MQELNGQDDREDSREMNVVEERQLLSRYGIWLLVGQCTPDENTPDVSVIDDTGIYTYNYYIYSERYSKLLLFIS